MEYVQFTKRTNDPKLKWLEGELDEAGIKHYRDGESFHAPIMMVEKDKEEEAWDILGPVDNVPDDDKRYQDNT